MKPKHIAAIALMGWMAATAVANAQAQQSNTQPVVAVASVNVPRYMGTWYQVAWFPNRFQKQCVSDTAATYSQRPDGSVNVLNRCKTADGSFDDAVGLARPAGSQIKGDNLEPAQLEVSFLPTWLRWLPIWGNYWVLKLADDGRYSVVGEGTREYLWVLSRTPTLSAADEIEIRSRLVQLGYNLAMWQAHPHTAAAPAR